MKLTYGNLASEFITDDFLGSTRPHVGRPKIMPQICKIIPKMARENRTWGSERIHGQLKNININVSTEAIRQPFEGILSSLKNPDDILYNYGI
jgi:hypothetical protein